MDYKCLAFDWHGSLFSWPAFWKGLKVAACKVVSRAQKKTPAQQLAVIHAGKTKKPKKKRKQLSTKLALALTGAWDLIYQHVSRGAKRNHCHQPAGPPVYKYASVCVCASIWQFQHYGVFVLRLVAAWKCALCQTNWELGGARGGENVSAPNWRVSVKCNKLGKARKTAGEQKKKKGGRGWW